jgi:hypothetical protein
MSEGWSMAASIPFKKPDRDIRPSPPEERTLGYASTPRTALRADLNESCAQFFESAPRKRNARRRPHALISKLNQSILQELPPLCPEYCEQGVNGMPDVLAKCDAYTQNSHTRLSLCPLVFPVIHHATGLSLALVHDSM